MDDLEISTFVTDEDRFLKTYFGKLLLQPGPLYVPNHYLTKPTVVIGRPGAGKSEFLMSVAAQCASKGMLVINMDFKFEKDFKDDLYFWAHKACGREFLCFCPTTDLDAYTNTFNPFFSLNHPIQDIAGAFFDAYQAENMKPGAAQFYYENERNIFIKLLRALHSSGLGYSINDVRNLLEHPQILESIGSAMKRRGGDAANHYNDVRNYLLKQQGKKAIDDIRGFINYLSKFDHWALNDQNPEICFDKLIYTDAFCYIGLPVNKDRAVMKSIGAVIMNQLKALSSWIQNHETTHQRGVVVIVDEAQACLNPSLVDWLLRVRSSGIRVILSFQGIANLYEVSDTFPKQLLEAAANVVMFDPNDRETAEWFSKRFSEKSGLSYRMDVGKEEGHGSVGVAMRRQLHSDEVMNLRVGQAFYDPPIPVDRPYLFQSCMLPKVPRTPENRHQRRQLPIKAEFRGLSIQQQIRVMQRHLAGSGSPL